MIRGAMSEQRKALGKGLGSLLPMGNKSNATGFFECSLTDIIPNADQPRKLFSKDALDELANSISEKGIIQPLVVRPIGGGKYELIAGERRYRAAKQIGLGKVPVVVKETDESETLEIALIENIQRQDLNPIEEALAYKELLSRHQYTQDELARKIGKDRSSIANSLRLLKLPDKVRDYLINNKISMGHARAILSVENKELQNQVADDIVKHNLSVREVEVLTKKMKEQVAKEHSKSDDEKKSDPVKEYTDLLKQLEGHLMQKVAIRAKGDKGQIIISFKGQGELKSLTEKLLKD